MSARQRASYAKLNADRSAPERVLNELVESMPERVTPRCRHFGTCGGCQLQHLPQSAQLAAKEAMIVRILQQAGMHTLPAVQVHAAEPWQYRNRVRMRVEQGQIGYSKRGSNDFLAIEECPILSPLLWQTGETLRTIVRENKASWPAATASFELFTTADEAALQLAIQLDADVSTVDRDAPAQFRQLCAALQHWVPQLAGAGLSVTAASNATQNKRVQESQRVEIAHWGAAELPYRVGAHNYQVTRNAFFQVNRLLTASMVDLVVGTHRGEVAWDLFAGAGLFSVPLTEHFTRVTAVEIGEPAASDLQTNLQARGTQHRAVRSTTLGFLQQQPAGVSPDLVVLDPPRAGLGLGVAEALVRTTPQQIVYVSCDAGTFARDASALVRSGYAWHELHLLDLFPQTFHTETVAVFRRP